MSSRLTEGQSLLQILDGATIGEHADYLVNRDARTLYRGLAVADLWVTPWQSPQLQSSQHPISISL